FPLRPMAGRCALNVEIVVRVHGREPELWSIGRMADCLSAGTGSTPVSSAINLREIRPAARTLVFKTRYEGASSQRTFLRTLNHCVSRREKPARSHRSSVRDFVAMFWIHHRLRSLGKCNLEPLN